jgi:anti-sigma regulatory factor (Ser/Thr protein kinase)
MSVASWVSRPRPSAGPDAVIVGEWAPRSAADLTAARRQLAAALGAAAERSGPDEDSAERLLLAFEELVSNALRHGRVPVAVAVTSFDGCWLLEVSDAAVDRPPSPAEGRDAARGGLGLHLVARICGAVGWQADGPRKIVWARIDLTGSGRPQADPEECPAAPSGPCR